LSAKTSAAIRKRVVVHRETVIIIDPGKNSLVFNFHQIQSRPSLSKKKKGTLPKTKGTLNTPQILGPGENIFTKD